MRRWEFIFISPGSTLKSQRGSVGHLREDLVMGGNGEVMHGPQCFRLTLTVIQEGIICCFFVHVCVPGLFLQFLED